MNKITLVKTADPESKLCSRLLEENKIKFRKVYSDSDEKPFLLIGNEAFAYRGLSQIRSYVNSTKNYSKK